MQIEFPRSGRHTPTPTRFIITPPFLNFCQRCPPVITIPYNKVQERNEICKPV